MNKLQQLLAVALFSGSTAQAADINRDIFDDESGNSSFLEFGFSVNGTTLPLIGFNGREEENSDGTIIDIDLGLQARFEYKGFFAEVIEDSFSDVALGFTAYESENTSIDIIASSIFGQIRRNDLAGFESITTRKGDINFGIRGSRTSGQNIMQFELLHDVHDAHNGAIASVQFGQRYQVRNWNIHALAGVRYFSGDVIDHYFGVSDAEATQSVVAYDAEQGFFPTIKIGATLPINEKWIFRTSAEYSKLPRSVRESPLAQGDNIYGVSAGIYRVLFSG